MTKEVKQICYSLLVAVILLFSLHGATGFFIKHVDTGKCINDVGKVLLSYSTTGQSPSKRSQRFVETSDDCFDQASQFNFRDTGAILKINVPGCLQAVDRYISNEGTLHLLVIHSDNKNNIDDLCSDNNAVTQTSWGGLRFWFYVTNQLLCSVPATSNVFKNNYGVDPYVKITNCNEKTKKRFYIGSVTCFGEKITNASCPNNQYMMIKTAEYRGLNKGNVCGSSYNYNCSFDVTCYLKRHCDGQRVCNVTVDDNLFPSNICVGLNKYLYFEYQCNNTMTSFDHICHNTTGFFIKHVETGKCIYDTKIIQSRFSPPTGGERTLHYLELSDNCFDQASQFKFLDNSAILKLNVPGCLQGEYKIENGLDMLYIHTDTHNVNYAACGNNNAVTQTSWGGLQIRYRRAGNRCLEPLTSQTLKNNEGVDPYLKMAKCSYAQNKIFHFGTIACFRQKMTNVSCPKNQYMIIKNASYRGLTGKNVCGSRYDYSCSVDVTCHLKRHCDGKQECDVIVHDNLFPLNICPGLNKYLYFEYQCSSTSFVEICYLERAYLSNSIFPNQGVVNVITKYDSNFTICKDGSLDKIKDDICMQFGYPAADSIKIWTSSKDDQIFLSGELSCNNQAKNISQCVIITKEKCSQHSLLKCHICARPLLNDTKKFPDSLFSASNAINLHNAADARISSGRSWCAPTADGNHYLQISFEKLYAINSVAIFGDTTTLSWVKKYHINTTSDLINWESVSNQNSQKVFKGNKNAYKDAAISTIKGGTRTRALRLIPVTYNNRPCIRVELCGGELLPSSPTGLNITYSASRYVIISWMDPQSITVTPGADVVNPLTKFRLILRKQRKVILNKTEPSNVAKPYMLSNLIPNTMYTVVVTAGNSEGFGDAANVSFKTKEDVPEGPPLNITISDISSSSLSVTWEPPDKSKRNGRIVNYTVCITPSESFKCSETFTTEYQSFIINELKPATTYYVWVLASTKIGFGNYSEKQMAITNGLPPKATVNSSEKTLTFSLEIPTVKYEYLFVIAMQGDRQNLPSPSALNVEDLETYSTPSLPNLYVAAVLKPSGDGIFLFILGDGSNSSISGIRGRRSPERVYHNAPLKPNTTYRIFQRVVINDQGDYYSTEWSSSARTASELLPLPGDSKDDDNNVTAFATASAAAVVFAIVFVVLIILWRRRRAVFREPKSHLQSEHEDRNGQELSVRNDAFIVNDIADPVVRPNEENIYVNKSFSEEEMYGNKETIETRNRLPIPLANFTEHVKKLRRKNMEELRLEFEDLPNGQKCNWVIAKSPMNSAKNRYGNAVTYDHSRVILSGDEKSDYINASFVDGKCEKYYIATQGPKPKTVNDFWRMIFEQKCPAIVMLTTLKEMGKVKCEKYWPDESNVYGEFQVTVTETKTFADYVTRIMVVEKDGEHHEVEQFHYKSWPDYGVPRYPTQLLTFRNHFKLSHKTKSGPVVVHCSAGVGRTGVFIALDKILDDLDDEYETNIDVFGFVEEMRSRRINMVQTADQYMFIHDAIIDHIQCGANEIDAVQIKIEIAQLSKKSRNGKTGFEQKFERLQSITPELPEELCEAALSDENKKKNRYPKIYPMETNRPILRRVEHLETSDYINACLVDGYLGKNYFIATQMPLKVTINDFWRMVTQYKCTTIVLLNQLTDDNKEYPMFWPTKRATSRPYGTCTVLFDSVVKKEDIVVRKLIASPTLDIKEGHMVHIIQYLSWPNHGVPKDVRSLLNVLSEVEEAQRSVEVKGPVVVVCSDGAGRSGTYITISNLVDRVKIVQVIDVFQCIKLIRSRRPQFVETAEQFKFCYNAVSCVLESFDEYSNFTELATI